jgi:hypothetical protein
MAVLFGTPPSSNSKFGSPVMTVRAEKSTRLPIRLPRRRPTFLETSVIGLHGLSRLLECLGDACSAVVRVCRNVELCRKNMRGASRKVDAINHTCSNCSNSVMICAGAPSVSHLRTLTHALMMSPSLYVKSSSLRIASPSTAILGRAGRGGDR